MLYPKLIQHHFLRHLVACLSLLVLPATLTLTTTPASANTSVQPVHVTLNATTRADIIKDIVTGLTEQYVDEELGKRIGATIMAAHKAGAYDKLDNPAQFAEVISHDLRAINGDLHLSLRATNSGQTNGPIMMMKGPGETLSKEEKQAMEAATAAARRDNFGLGRVEILDGNIGYLEIRGFNQDEGYEEVVVNALRFLERSDAIIIDLRRNHGGSGEMSHFIFSHFLGDKPVPTINFTSRNSKLPETMTSLEKVPGPRRPNVPLYVLTSQGTASAAEEFSFVLQNQHRATIVGSRTAGAGHMVTSVPVAHGFVLGVSITRVTDPVSGKEWEGTGVQADIKVKPEQALNEAYAAALTRVIADCNDQAVKRQLERLLTATDARRHPQLADASTLASYVGVYEGRQITLSGNTLSYNRVGGLPEELIYLGNDHFALGSSQLHFEKNGDKQVLIIENAEGAKLRLERS